MYSSQLKIKDGFTAVAKTAHDEEYSMYIEEEKDGPMDIFAVAYNGCVSMCAKGYFWRAYEDSSVAVETKLDVDYDNKKITANILVDRTEEQLAAGDREGVLENIKLRCKVSHLLSKDLEIEYNVKSLK